jgi:outer membrane protein OmpA-like peptidoglycan-associated protein
MRHSRNGRAVAVLIGAAVVLGLASGCATKSYVRDRVAELGNRVDSENAGIRTDLSRTGTLAENASTEAARSRMLALGNVDYRTTEQYAVTFGFDSAELTSDARMTLDQVTSTVHEHPNYIVDLLGHACTIGPESYNEELSRRRASAVLHYLVQHGPGPVGRYAIVGLGESLPVVAGGSEDHTASRRVEISLLERVDPGSGGSKPVISQADPDQ